MRDKRHADHLRIRTVQLHRPLQLGKTARSQQNFKEEHEKVRSAKRMQAENGESTEVHFIPSLEMVVQQTTAQMRVS